MADRARRRSNAEIAETHRKHAAMAREKGATKLAARHDRIAAEHQRRHEARSGLKAEKAAEHRNMAAHALSRGSLFEAAKHALAARKSQATANAAHHALMHGQGAAHMHALQRGKHGGTFVVSSSGKKEYLGGHGRK
jgi:hypothetical protein